MKQFLVVLRYELKGHFQNKVYRLSTIFVTLLLVIGLSFPTIKNLISGDDNESSTNTDTQVEGYLLDGHYLLVDEKGYLSQDVINLFCDNCMKDVSTQKEAEDLLTNSSDYDAVFVVTSDLSYKYIVNNQSFSIMGYDNTTYQFESLLRYQYQTIEFEALDINFTKVMEVMNTSIQKEEIVLGKDSTDNYMATYVLIFVLYMMVLLYGQNIAVAVASEKSNRAVEILVTSSSSNALIFGKVIAGAIASIIQFGVIVIAAVATYHYNYDAWNGALDVIFKIPVDVLITFGIFGVLGYLLYAFIYGAIGAIVQKSEEVNSSAIPITIIYVIAFMVTYFGMMIDANGILLKIASYIPLSSFMAMFTRVSMGSGVSMVEIMVSLVILIGTTGLIGLLAAKIYRMGTLMYGNKIKISTILKQIGKENKKA